MADHHPCLTEFFIAEHHLKNNDPIKAAESYRQCLSINQRLSPSDPIDGKLILLIERRLLILENQNPDKIIPLDINNYEYFPKPLSVKT